MKTALIIGRAQGVWEEVDAANQFVGSVTGPFDLVVAVNNAGVDYPYVDHWVSFHADKFEEWVEQRAQKGFAPVKGLWTSTYGRKESAYEKRLGEQGVKKIAYHDGGSSGLVAVFVALRPLEATHVVIAGIPMDIERGHYNEAGPWKEAVKHRKAWKKVHPQICDKVRSMSGWTQAELGAPTEEWLRA